MFGLMQIFAAVGQSCYSGTFLALMYEDVEHDKSITKSPNVIFSNLQVINLVSVLLAALISWIIRDSKDSFASLWRIFQDALIIPQ